MGVAGFKIPRENLCRSFRIDETLRKLVSAFIGGRYYYVGYCYSGFVCPGAHVRISKVTR